MFKFRFAVVLSTALVLQSGIAFASPRLTAAEIEADKISTAAVLAMHAKNYKLALYKWDELRAGQTLWSNHNYLYRAECLRALGRYQEALEDLKKLDPWDKKTGYVRRLQADCQKLEFQDPLRLGSQTTVR